jgi:hypothetical protein
MFIVSNLLSEDTNLLEIYICNKQQFDNYIDVTLDDSKIQKLKNKFKMTKTSKYNIFYKNNLSYTYDDSNDNQIVNTKITYKNLHIKSKSSFSDFYAISYKEDKLPTHYFPCTNNIDYISEVYITEIKINNRVTLIIKTDNNITSAYIQYRHANNVEIDKIQAAIEMLLKTISSLT